MSRTIGPGADGRLMATGRAETRSGKRPTDLAIAGLARAPGRLVDLAEVGDLDPTLKVSGKLEESGGRAALAGGPATARSTPASLRSGQSLEGLSESEIFARMSSKRASRSRYSLDPRRMS
jgi:hypothetical protein